MADRSERHEAPTFAGMDPGSKWITVFVMTLEPDPRFKHAVRVPSAGISGGVVTSIAEATGAITNALVKAEEELSHTISSACVAVGDEHLNSQNVSGSVSITPRGHLILPDDVARAIAAARGNLRLGEHRRILHEIPRAFQVDSHPGVRDPLGMAASLLEVEVHCTTASANILQNLLTCVDGSGVHQALAMASPLAAGAAVIDAYRDHDCLAVLDIGYQTTKLAVYYGGTIWHTHVLRTGGQGFTDALVAEMHLSPHAAELVKLRYGSCNPADAEETELIEMPPSLGEFVLAPRRELLRVLHEHAQIFSEDVLDWFQHLRNAGVVPSVVVLVGGGAELPGLDMALAAALDTEVEVGVPARIRDLPRWAETPAYATAAGLARWYASMDQGGKGRGHDGPRSPWLRRLGNALGKSGR